MNSSNATSVAEASKIKRKLLEDQQDDELQRTDVAHKLSDCRLAYQKRNSNPKSKTNKWGNAENHLSRMNALLRRRKQRDGTALRNDETSAIRKIDNLSLNNKIEDEALRDENIFQATPDLFCVNGSNGGSRRKQPSIKFEEEIRNQIRTVAEGIPEVHFIGEVQSGSGFNQSSISCKWSIEWGNSWSFLSGEFDGQTQYAFQGDSTKSIWNHPIDVHFATASIKGWPRLIVQVWEFDDYGRTNLAGYGFAHMPSTPGYHYLDMKCWRPSGSIGDEIQSFFLGTSTQLNDKTVIFGRAWDSRHKIITIPSGQIRICISVIQKCFAEQLIDNT